VIRYPVGVGRFFLDILCSLIRLFIVFSVGFDNLKLLKRKMNANDLKDQGNMYFAARRFDDAVSCYTKAIVSNVTVTENFQRRVSLLGNPKP